jgi:hypothetical protein
LSSPFKKLLFAAAPFEMAINKRVDPVLIEKEHAWEGMIWIGVSSYGFFGKGGIQKKIWFRRRSVPIKSMAV